MFTFHVGGIDVTISIFSLILVLLIAKQAYEYVKKQMVGRGNVGGLHIAGLVASVAITGSLILHELAHGLVVYLLGYNLTEVGMRWWGAFVRPETSIFDMPPVQIVMIAAVGPMINLVIGLYFLALVLVLKESVLENTLQFVAYFNFLMFVWNMVPLVFTDGAKVLVGIVWLVIGSEVLAKGSLLVGPIITLVGYLFYTRALKKSFHDLTKAV